MKRSIAIADRGTYAERPLLWLVLLSGAVLVGLLWTTAASGATAYYSFTGQFGLGSDIQSFVFDVASTLPSPGPFSLRTWHHSGGVNAAGETIAGGAFDPILRLYGGETLVAVDDDIDRSILNYDAELTWGSADYRPPEIALRDPLRGGTYRLDLASLGGGSSGHWAVDLLSEASTFTLTGIGDGSPVLFSLKVGSSDPNVPSHLALSDSPYLSYLTVASSGGATADFSGSVDAGWFSIGGQSGSVGNVTLSGGGSWSDLGAFGAWIGLFGEGNLVVHQAGDARIGYQLSLGHEVGGQGSLTISGINSQATVTGNVFIGFDGTGTVRVEDQGMLDSSTGFGGSSTAVVAAYGGSSGTVDVDGDGSRWSSGILHVGDGGQGIVRVTNGGKIDTTGSAYVARTAGAAASSVTVSGMSPQLTKATWDISDNLFIAGDELGPASAPFSKLTIMPGGRVDVAGTTTVWNGGGSLELLGGEMETGSLDVKSGATFTHTDGTLTVDGGTFDPGVSNYNYTIDGVTASDLPIVRLLGGASTSLSESVLVGHNQNGRLEAHDGSDISLAGPYSRLLIGHGPDSHGEVIVSGQGSSLTTTGGFTVGYEGHGVLRVLDGGVVSDTAASSGEMIAGVGGTGLVEVAGTAPDGTPSTYTAHGLFYVGPGGHATLTISNGGRVNALAYAAIVGDYGTSATVSGAGSRWSITDALYVGGNDMMGGGSGRLTIMNGGLVSADRVTIWEPGAVELSGGTVHTGSIALEGTLRGTGNVTGGGQLDNAGLVSPGLLTPGAAAGTIHLAGDYIQLATGAMEMEIGGLAPSQFDRLQVDGAATLGGSLRIDLIDPMGGSNPYQPSAGDSFPLLTAGLLGPPSFSDVILPVLGPDLRMVVIGDLQTSILSAHVFWNGDYNFDGLVDAADYTVWRDTLGSTTDLRANGDDTGASAGVIDQADYSMWKLHFGVDTGSGAKAAFFSSADASVPGPSTYWLLGPATAWGASRWRFARRGGLHISPHHRLCNLNSRTMVR